MIPRVPLFRFASAEAFRSRCPQFSDFLLWEQGSLWALINSEPVYQQLAAFSLRELPAVASITHLLDPILAPIDYRAAEEPEAARLAGRLRRAIGSMIREVLEANGFRKTGRLRAVAPKPRRLFVRAEVFELVSPKPPLEDDDGFDWDEFAQIATFKQICQLSPDLSGRRLPSMYSPDRRWFYVSSQDIGVQTSSEKRLRQLLEAVRRSYHFELDRPKVDHGRLHTQRVDFYELCRLIANLVPDPDDFADPDILLEQAL
jgi:hypothetical protein